MMMIVVKAAVSLAVTVVLLVAGLEALNYFIGGDNER